MKRKVLFIDRDGTLIVEPPQTFQVDTLEQLQFMPGVIRNLYFIRKNTDFELVIVSNQDGLGTPAYPQEHFDSVQNKMLQILGNEGITFDEVLIDPSMPEENSPNRKPGTGMLKSYMTDDYDLANSFVIGDRVTDLQLAENLGCKAIILHSGDKPDLKDAIKMDSWDNIRDYLFAGERKASVHRITKETDIFVSLDIDGKGECDISTGIGFFDHLLEQIARHGSIDLIIRAKGDLHVDEHHTVEDVGITLGEALLKTLGDKRGIERYGFCLPMDDCLCGVAIDFGGRAWLVWDAHFQRERVGELPTEMLYHFFKSLSDAAKMNINIKAEGFNEHHKAEGIFKAFAKAVKMAVRRDVFNYRLPSTKEVI